MHGLRLAVSLAAITLVAACGRHGGSVARTVDGRTIEGRFVPPAAYADYARGAYLEARGDAKRALEAYRRAAASDARSPEIWTRIGAIRCADDEIPLATAFAEAAQLDPAYGPMWHERARCLLRRGSNEAALEDAQRAAALSPDDPEATLLVARILQKMGASDAGRRWIRAFALRAGRSIEDEAGVVGASGGGGLGVDAALRDQRLDDARTHAKRARWSSGRLAARAAELGLAALAKEQATLVLAADPNDPDALVAALVAADLEGDDAALAKWLSLAVDDPFPPDPRVSTLMQALLERRVGTDAAQAWEAAYAGEDPRP